MKKKFHRILSLAFEIINRATTCTHSHYLFHYFSILGFSPRWGDRVQVSGHLGPDHVQVFRKCKCFGNISQLETRPLIAHWEV